MERRIRALRRGTEGQLTAQVLVMAIVTAGVFVVYFYVAGNGVPGGSPAFNESSSTGSDQSSSTGSTGVDQSSSTGSTGSDQSSSTGSTGISSSSGTGLSSSSSGGQPALPCDVNPCLYGGTCVNGDMNYTCVCHQGFSGPLCQFEVSCAAFRPEVPILTWADSIAAIDPAFVPGGASVVTVDERFIWITSGVPNGGELYHDTVYIGFQTIYRIDIRTSAVVQDIIIPIGSQILFLIQPERDILFIAALGALGNSTDWPMLIHNTTLFMKLNTSDETILARQSGFDILLQAPLWIGATNVLIATGFALASDGTLSALVQNLLVPGDDRPQSYHYALSYTTLLAVSVMAVGIPNLIMAAYALYNPSQYYTQLPAVLYQQAPPVSGEIDEVDARFNDTGAVAMMFSTPFNDLYEVFFDIGLSEFGLQQLRFNLTNSTVPNALGSLIPLRSDLRSGFLYVTPWRTVILSHLSAPYLTAVACACAANETFFNTKCQSLCLPNPCAHDRPCTVNTTTPFGYECACLNELGHDCEFDCLQLNTARLWTSWSTGPPMTQGPITLGYTNATARFIWIAAGCNQPPCSIFQITYDSSTVLRLVQVPAPVRQLSSEPGLLHVALLLCSGTTVCFSSTNLTSNVTVTMTAATVLSMLSWIVVTQNFIFLPLSITPSFNDPDRLILSVALNPGARNTGDNFVACDTFASCVIRGYTFEVSRNLTVVYRSRRIPLITNTTFIQQTGTNLDDLLYLYGASPLLLGTTEAGFWAGLNLSTAYDATVTNASRIVSFDARNNTLSVIQAGVVPQLAVGHLVGRIVQLDTVLNTTSVPALDGNTIFSTVAPWGDIVTTLDPGLVGTNANITIYSCVA